MCLIGFRWQPEGETPLLLAANRDEFYERPTAPMAWWEPESGGRSLLAGRDLQGGGTWLGLTADGRCAALTNHRDPARVREGRPSRGHLPVRFLEGRQDAGAFLEGLRREAQAYNPFNLLLYDGNVLLGYESAGDRVVPLEPGVHAVSNGAFDSAWPKVEALKMGLAGGLVDDRTLLSLLADGAPHADERLPETGVSLAWERALSPAFIRTPTYGTRNSTILHLGREEVAVLEQRFTWEGPSGRSEFRFRRVR